jgi:predicted acyl esterase
MRILTAPAIVRCLVVSLAVLGIAAVAPDLASAADPQVEILWGVEIPVRDGITLNATVYEPLEMEEPLPVVFTLTPYTSDTYHDAEHSSFLEIPIVR